MTGKVTYSEGNLPYVSPPFMDFIALLTFKCMLAVLQIKKRHTNKFCLSSKAFSMLI